ncbi:MAG: Asp-tRNA(Asn)/Glu-tRNA(Gln) amidotransferase subunit GatC [Vicinamibacterales bacterium]|nr:Asp-tRNA(Asn)/Glu-tRNA(Gln) amidotransferase subunit GatC [Vicinamibacterales bacterium]
MSVPLSPEEVARVAALAHLDLTDDEVVLFGRQLADILGYVAEIQAVDTSGVLPTAHVLDRVPLDRADEPRPTLPREEALANAPEAAQASGLFKVPRVIG